MYGIFAYIYHKNQPNVGKYTSPMDPMGLISCHYVCLNISKLPVCLELVFARIQQSVTAVSGDFEVQFRIRDTPPGNFWWFPWKGVSVNKGKFFNPQHVVLSVLPDTSEPHLQKLSELG